MTFSKEVPLTWNFGELNHKEEHKIGVCEITENKEINAYTATLNFHESKSVAKDVLNLLDKLKGKSKLFPAIGVSHVIRNKEGQITACKLVEVSIWTSNIDKSIPPIDISKPNKLK